MSNLATNEGISRSAARLRWAVFAALVLMVSLYAAARLGLDVGGAHIEYRAHGPANLAWLVADGSMALLVVALLQLTEMLRRIASGALFSSAVVRSFRGFALWLLLMALFELLAPIVLQLGTAGRSHRLEMAIDFRLVLTVGITLLLFLLARLLERARRLDEEMREFV
jgi:hypothetical protein